MENCGTVAGGRRVANWATVAGGRREEKAAGEGGTAAAAGSLTMDAEGSTILTFDWDLTRGGSPEEGESSLVLDFLPDDLRCDSAPLRLEGGMIGACAAWGLSARQCFRGR